MSMCRIRRGWATKANLAHAVARLRSHDLGSKWSLVLARADQPLLEQLVRPAHEPAHDRQLERQPCRRHRALEQAHECARRALAWTAVQEPPQDDAQVDQV